MLLWLKTLHTQNNIVNLSFAFSDLRVFLFKIPYKLNYRKYILYYVFIWSQAVIINKVRSRSLKGKLQKFVSGLFFLIKNQFILYTKIAYDLRICNDFDPVMISGRKSAIFESCVFYVFFLGNHWKFLVYTKIVYEHEEL